MQLEVKQLRIDGGTELRAAINNEAVMEYAEALRGGAEFPPVVAFHDGEVYWLTDGFHRWHAHRQAGLEKIEVDVREGDLRDALLFSAGANAEHGLRRNREDRRKAIATLLTHELVRIGKGGKCRTDREIARICRVDHKTVGQVRKELSGEIPQMDTTARAVTRGGSEYVQDTTNIRRANRARKQEPAEPAAAARPDCKFHAVDGPVPMQGLQLPLENPEKAARSMWSIFDAPYMERFSVEIIRISKSRTSTIDRVTE